MKDKPTILVFMVADGIEPAKKQMTQKAINTAKERENIEVCVIETGLPYQTLPAPYQNCIVYPGHFKEFNYNHALNTYVKFYLDTSKYPEEIPEYLAFCNNDLIFHTGWSGIVEDMRRRGYRSASPWCPKSHPRYHDRSKEKVFQGAWTRKNLAGWCFIWETSLWEELGGLPEDYTFYCSDNATEKLLREHSIAHALFRDYEVTHLGSQTLKSAPEEFRKFHCDGQVKKWNKENNVNMFNLGT